MTCSSDRAAGPRLEQIRASAGSGKTYALTRRFIALLDDAAPYATPPAGRERAFARESSCAWSEILAATFTNKAAAEMKERVLATLKKRALGLDGAAPSPFPAANAAGGRPLPDPAAGRWVETILRRYSALNIRTIDSLLTLFVRLSALNLGLLPDFTPSFNAREYFSPVFDALTLEAREHDGPIRHALLALCRARLHWLEASSAERKPFLAGKNFADPLLEILTIALQSPECLPKAVKEQDIWARIEVMQRAVADSAETLLCLLESEKLHGAGNFMTFLDNAARPESLTRALESAYAAKSCLDECLLKASRGKASEKTLQAFALLRKACDRAKNIALLREAVLTISMLNLTAPLMDRLMERMAGDGLVPAVLLPRLAAHTLNAGGASEAFCRLGARLRHLLIDEFQDTSREQWQAILPLAVECLAKGGSLTYVGDAKQAIYGFRGGDVALFDEALTEQELTAIVPSPRSTTLACNWRSAPAIVSHNNALFSQLENPEFAMRAAAALLPAHAPGSALKETASMLAAAFAQTAQAMPAGKRWDISGYVRLCRLHEANKATLEERVYDELRRVFDELLARRAPGDIAVLARTNNQCAAIAERLLDWGVPVVTENSLLIGSHPLVRQLASFLEFLDNPLNGVALYEFLCGPDLFGAFSGMERAAVENWLARARLRASPALRDASWAAEAFRRDAPAAWERCIAPFHARAGLMSAYDLAHEILNFYKVFQRFPHDTLFLRRFLELAHGAEGKGRGSLSAFLAWWRENKDSEKLPMPETMDAVQVLTMHKAKGLEFPVAVIPFGDAPRGQEKGYMRHTVEGLDLLLRPGPALGPPYFQRAAARAMETVNLLYVAWTRPVEELHAFITSTRQTANAPQAAILDLLTAGLSWNSDGVFELGVRPSCARPAGATPFNRTDAPDSATAPQAATANTKTPSFTTTAESANAADAKEPLAPSTHCAREPQRPMAWLPQLKIFRNALELPLFGERQRGLLIHACLERLGPAARFAANRQTIIRDIVRAGMAAFALPIPNPDQTMTDIADMMRWLLEQPGMAQWIADGTPEQEILDEDGNFVRADLAVHYPAYSVVLEYKTGADDSMLPEPAHMRQLLRYMRLTSAARNRPTRGFLAYLDRRLLFEASAS